MTRQPGHAHTFTAPAIAEAVGQAMAFIVPARDGQAAEHATTLVYAGEAQSIEEAMREALDDIRAQCVQHRCTPLDVTTDGVMATDAGTRIWGTVSCGPGMTAALPPTEVLAFTAIQKGNQWELTVTRK